MRAIIHICKIIYIKYFSDIMLYLIFDNYWSLHGMKLLLGILLNAVFLTVFM